MQTYDLRGALDPGRMRASRAQIVDMIDRPVRAWPRLAALVIAAAIVLAGGRDGMGVGVGVGVAAAQGTVGTVVVVCDQKQPTPYVTALHQELQSVVGSRRARIELRFGDHSPSVVKELLDRAYGERDVRVVITAGPLASAKALERATFPKPTIVDLVVDPALQKVPRTDAGTSGKTNLNYIVPPTDVKKDLALLYEIRPFRKLAILGSPSTAAALPFIDQYVSRAMPDEAASHELVVGNSADELLRKLPADTDAVYLLPLVTMPAQDERRRLYAELARRRLPNVALVGRPAVENGAMASIAAATNFAKVVRRIAIHTNKILEGSNAADLSVDVAAYRDDLVFNMRAVRVAGVFPSFDLLARATLIDVIALPGAETLSLRAAVAGSLEANLELQSARVGRLLGDKQIELARATLLPQVDLSTTMVGIDEQRVASSFGSQARVTWSGAVELRQVVFSEPALANLAIQKMLAEARKHEIADKELDVVQRTTAAYLDVLLARNLVRLQNQNVSVSRRNLDVAHVRVEAGQTSAADVNRWESELALGKMNLLDSQAQLRGARHALNRILHRPLDAEIEIVEMTLDDVFAEMLDNRLVRQLDNPGSIEHLVAFMIAGIDQSAPLLAQIDTTIDAQKRLLRSYERADYVPTVALFADLGYTLGRFGQSEVAFDPTSLTDTQREVVQLFDQVFTEPSRGPTWTLGLTVSLPLFEGGANRTRIEKTALEITRLHRDREAAKEGLELSLRVATERTGTGFAKIGLSRHAADAARKSLALTLESYVQGAVTITQVLDAQRAALQADTQAANTVYEFLSAYIDIERATGNFYFLSSQTERDDFYQRFQTYMKERAR